MRHDNGPMLIVITVLSACSASDRGVGFSVRDSAGIRIAENWLAESVIPEWSLEPEPQLNLGELDGDSAFQFFRVTDVDVSSDGHILVSQLETPHLRLFSPGGEFIRMIGSFGDGPGEFRSVGTVQVDSDSIMVFDGSLRRVTMASLTGAMHHTTPLRATTGISTLYRLSDGRYVAVGAPDSRSQMALPQGLHRLPVPVLILGSDGATVDSLGVYPGIELQIVMIEGGSGRAPAIWGRKLAVQTRGMEVIIGTGEAFELQILEPPKRLTRIVRVADADLTIRPEEWTEYKRKQLASIESADSRAFMEHFLEESTVPDGRAAFTRILVDDRGRLWLSPYEGRGNMVEGAWHVVDENGRLIAKLSVPEAFRILAIGSDMAYGVWRGELDVESIRAYRIVSDVK